MLLSNYILSSAQLC